jgi:hypothetical protein
MVTHALFYIKLVKMAPAKTLSAEHAAILRAGKDRRAAVIALIKRDVEEMRDEQVCADVVAAVEEDVLREVFETGHDNPKRGVGADFVAWHVDRELWHRFLEALGKPFPFESACPSWTYGPWSVKFRRYQEARVARESASQYVGSSNPRFEDHQQERNLAEPSSKGAKDLAGRQDSPLTRNRTRRDWSRTSRADNRRAEAQGCPRRQGICGRVTRQ